MRQSLIFLLYRLALWLASPFIVLYLAIRSCKNPLYWRTWPERFGWLPPLFRQTSPGAVWLHAVSVGEVISAATFLAEFRKQDRSTPVFVSVGTLAGREIADKRLAPIATGVFYGPLDFVWIVRRVLRRIKPSILIVLETEIWPNLWRETKRSGAALLIVNGRISDRAFPRYERWRWAFSAILPLADEILAQTEVSRDRYIALGADPASTRAAGNLKYDFAAAENHPPTAVVEWLNQRPGGQIWIAASTMPPAREGDPDEDEAVLDAFEQLAPEFPDLVLLLVPRRPERFETAAASLTGRGIAYVQRSRLPAPPGRVLLVDSMGELGGLFRLADLVFMGGSLPERGGHNILEPAFFDKPVVSGPHLENFPEIAAEFRKHGAMLEIASARELAPAVASLLRDPIRRAELGRRGGEIARARSGASATAVRSALDLRDNTLPRARRGLPARIALTPLAALWRAGTAIHRAAVKPRSLPKPVVSIGGISAGGSGKTPIAIAVARLLLDSGIEPAILTRGYRRRLTEPVAVPRGQTAPVEVTGDEAQVLIASGAASVGVGADRLAVARGLEADAYILDDGFQHWRLARTVDIAVIDTLDPFPGDACLPLGRLREPPSALARASAIVLSRCQPGRRYPALEREISRYNPSVPIFRSRLEPSEWVPAQGGDPVPLNHFHGGTVAAFCGLGNPDSFWRTLRELGYHPIRQTAFPDHHRYAASDLQLAAAPGVAALLTTQKDLWNLPPPGIATGPPCIYWLAVETVFDDGPAFGMWLRSRLG